MIKKIMQKIAARLIDKYFQLEEFSGESIGAGEVMLGYDKERKSVRVHNTRQKTVLELHPHNARQFALALVKKAALLDGEGLEMKIDPISRKERRREEKRESARRREVIKGHFKR